MLQCVVVTIIVPIVLLKEECWYFIYMWLFVIIMENKFILRNLSTSGSAPEVRNIVLNAF